MFVNAMGAHRHRVVCALAIILGSFLIPLAVSAADAKLAPPPATAQQDALKLVRDVYRDELAAAKKPTEKVALANKLVQTSTGEKDPAGRFALLTIARDTATEAGDLETAVRAIDELAKDFQVDALKTKVDVATTASKGLATAQARQDFVKQANSLLDEAITADRYDLAKPLADLTLMTARTVNDPALMKQCVSRIQQMREGEASYSEVQKALTTLTEKPTDPDANLKVGRYRGFVKGDWENGLPMLALGSDTGLKELAEKELQGVASADEQVKLADGWWDVAAKENDLTKLQVQRHAAKWYTEALPQLTGLAKAKVERRLKSEGLASAGTSPLKAGSSETTVTYHFVNEATIKKDWELDKKNWRVESAGLRLYNQDTTLASTNTYVGDMRLQIAYEMSDRCELWVTIWGERFEFKTAGKAVAQLERKGDIVMFASGKDKPVQVKLKESEAGLSSAIKIHLDQRNLYRVKMELLVESIMVKGSLGSDSRPKSGAEK